MPWMTLLYSLVGLSVGVGVGVASRSCVHSTHAEDNDMEVNIEDTAVMASSQMDEEDMDSDMELCDVMRETVWCEISEEEAFRRYCPATIIREAAGNNHLEGFEASSQAGMMSESRDGEVSGQTTKESFDIQPAGPSLQPEAVVQKSEDCYRFDGFSGLRCFGGYINGYDGCGGYGSDIGGGFSYVDVEEEAVCSTANNGDRSNNDGYYGGVVGRDSEEVLTVLHSEGSVANLSANNNENSNKKKKNKKKRILRLQPPQLGGPDIVDTTMLQMAHKRPCRSASPLASVIATDYSTNTVTSTTITSTNSSAVPGSASNRAIHRHHNHSSSSHVATPGSVERRKAHKQHPPHLHHHPSHHLLPFPTFQDGPQAVDRSLPIAALNLAANCALHQFYLHHVTDLFQPSQPAQNWFVLTSIAHFYQQLDHALRTHPQFTVQSPTHAMYAYTHVCYHHIDLWYACELSTIYGDGVEVVDSLWKHDLLVGWLQQFSRTSQFDSSSNAVTQSCVWLAAQFYRRIKVNREEDKLQLTSMIPCTVLDVVWGWLEKVTMVDEGVETSWKKLLEVQRCLQWQPADTWAVAIQAILNLPAAMQIQASYKCDQCGRGWQVAYPWGMLIGDEGEGGDGWQAPCLRCDTLCYPVSQCVQYPAVYR